jgi:NAD(P)H-dependent FMN reductase
MHILTICGSLRAGSLNHILLRLAVEALEKRDVKVEEVDLKKFPLPAYDGDLEARGIPREVTELGTRMAAANGLLIVTPEYNFSYPGHLKNTIDWLSRIKPYPWAGKAIGLMSASPSLVGGNRSLWRLRPSGDVFLGFGSSGLHRGGAACRSQDARTAGEDGGGIRRFHSEDDIATLTFDGKTDNWRKL